MLNIVCVKHGDLYGSDYVNKLVDMVRRNLADGTEGRFICFTDNTDGIDAGIECRTLPVGIKGWWNKLYLFKAGLFDDGDRIFYLDLDTIILNGLDDIIQYQGDFAILRDFYRPNGYQSSVMLFKANLHNKIWENFVKEGLPNLAGGDQAFIEKQIETVDILQDLFPKWFVSYKNDCRPMFPRGSRVVIFHGHPRPHETHDEWIEKIWKIGGGSSLELEISCNLATEEIFNNVRYAATLHHPWIDGLETHDGHAVIVGGGPSIGEYPEEIKRRKQEGQKIFALNNAFSWCQRQGIEPDYQVMVDGRADNVGFVPVYAFLGTKLLYASQVHPKVFQEAEAIAPIEIWHPVIDGIQDIIGKDKRYALIGGGSTVGLRAMCLAYVMGYRQLHLYGFDSSFKQGSHHAYTQNLNEGQRVITLTCDDREFDAAPWMVSQAEEFLGIASALLSAGCQITVHGDGLLPHMARRLQPHKAHVDIRADEIIARISERKEPIGAEIGVFAGELSQRLLTRHPGLTLYMVDSWNAIGHSEEYKKSGDFHASLSQNEQDDYMQRTMDNTFFAGPRAIIVPHPSVKASSYVPDKFLDFAFIDADHTYEGCKTDLETWFPKVSKGGYLCGHDYDHDVYTQWGVKKAVDEFCAEKNLTIETGENYTWFAKVA